jgi:hypothetical protein
MTNQLEKSIWKGIWQPVLVMACLIAIAGIVAACSSGGSGTTTSGMAQVNVVLSDPATCAAPNGPYSHVWVTITDVQANTNASAGPTDSSWVDLTPALAKAPMQVDLLAQANNQCFLATLGDNMQLQAGSYQQIRIMLADNSTGLTTNACGTAANCVMLTADTTNTPHALNLSSEAQTGLKIPSGQISSGAFTIGAGQTKDLDIDFNTCESIVQEGNGQYRLKPVLHAGEVSTTSVSMNGKVVTAGANPVAVAGAVVSLEQPDATGVDRVLVSTTTASDGTWVICPVMQGQTSKPYDVVVTGATSAGVLFAPSIVTGVTIGSTVGTVALNMPAGTNITAATSTAVLSGQVTSENASNAGTAIDATLTVLETFTNGTYTIPLPMTATQNAGTAVTVTTATFTSQSPACNPTSAFCADYGPLAQNFSPAQASGPLQVPAAGAYIGTWSSSGATLTQPTILPGYVVDGIATVPNSAATSDCANNGEAKAAILFNANAPTLAGTGNLAFTGCQ